MSAMASPMEHPLVVALHCSGSTGRQWKPLAEYLGGRCTLIAPDLIGCSAVGPWSGDHAFSLDDEARSVLTIIDHWPGPVHLVGHSYGGGVALHVARRRASRIASISLYEPSAFHLLPSMGPEGRAALREIKSVARAVQQGLLTGSYQAAVEHFVDYWNGTGSFAQMKPHLKAELIQSLPKIALDFAALFGGVVRLYDFRRLAIPTLVIRGEHAPRPTALIAQRLHAAARFGQHRLVRGAGHMGPVTHSQEVAAAIGERILGALSLAPLSAAA
jgi:pimeloyl-ACP methyl ester carboxylesterase